MKLGVCVEESFKERTGERPVICSSSPTLLFGQRLLSQVSMASSMMAH